MIFYLNKSFCFETISQFHNYNLPRDSETIIQVLGNIKKCSDRNMYHILQQAPIRQTIKSSLKLSKHSQVQPLHYSASAFQNFYNSTVKLRSTVFRNLLHFNVNHLRYTNFTDFLHFNVRDMRLIRPFLDKFRL